ncbi:DUF1836 domain-containing protein [Bacillus sp. FJAT-22090]|uniref:DUF1836 domain-containing protein n=1 Tax=Bacillus sp. FJAT-22090 TaxID=1581038 RepID=UPI0011A5F379|nr:DUF1836 domain-containing protein [Bacillus sp. FJAT-22090]
MKKSVDLINRLGLESMIHKEEIPDIDLYMDQVIQLFDSKFSQTLRSTDEKVLTKTMINNYAKGKLFIPIKNKKYSKQHIMLINLIYQLKGALSINDIKSTLDPINEKIGSNNFQLEEFYSYSVALQQENAQTFLEEMKTHENEIEQFEVDEELKQLLFIISLANMSNAYRRAAELLVDDLTSGKEQKK